MANRFLKTQIVLSFVLIFFLSNCSKKELELTILNNEFYAYCPNEKCISSEWFYKKKYEHNINVIRFKIKNNSNKTYFFMPICNDIGKGCSDFESFPKPNTGLSLNNIGIIDKNKKIIDNQGFFSHGNNLLDSVNQSNIIEYYAKMGYKKKPMNLYFKGLAAENILIIPANQTLYFESFFTLPFNRTNPNSTHEFIELDKNNNYKMFLRFSSEKKTVLNLINNAQKETIVKNNYTVFDGLLKSNQVPIIINE